MNKILLTCITIFLSSFVSAQINDLSQLAEGEMTNFQTLYDRFEKFYGYLAVYDKGKINSKERSFEIFLFDYSLNVVLSKNFTAKKEISSYGGYINKFDKLILSPYYEEKTNFIEDKFQLDLSENVLEHYKDDCFIHNEIQPCILQYSYKGIEEKREKDLNFNGYYDESSVTSLTDRSYLVFKSKNIKKHKKLFDEQYEILKFNQNKKLLWKYVDNPILEKDIYYTYHVLNKDTSSIFLMRMEFKKSDFVNTQFISINSKTGKVIKTTTSKEYKERSYYTFLSLMSGNRMRFIDGKKEFGNKIVFIGSMVQNRNNIIGEGDVGYIKLTYDSQTGETFFQTLSFFDLQKKFPDIDKFGKTEKYDLSLVAVFPFKNGKDILIFEKFKFSPNYWSGTYKPSSEDLVVVTTDVNFKPADINIINKRPTKESFSEFLYGQYLNDDTDLVFFYYDDVPKENKKKNDYYLYVNKIINQQFSQDNFIVSSQNNSVAPFIAKEGYILLREYNKDSKYNQIRLEKLNF